MENQFHRISKKNLYVEFQPSSFKTVRGDSGNRGMKFYFFRSLYKVTTFCDTGAKSILFGEANKLTSIICFDLFDQNK